MKKDRMLGQLSINGGPRSSAFHPDECDNDGRGGDDSDDDECGDGDSDDDDNKLL